MRALYHVPRSQVWEGSRGRQRGKVHLHVTEPFDLGRIHRRPGEALCGKVGWYEREPDGEDDLCPRCENIRDRAASIQTSDPCPECGSSGEHGLGCPKGPSPMAGETAGSFQETRGEDA